jgi:hypothetical protein
VEPVGSLIPAVTTIYPDMPEWRKSRRPLLVASGAVAAVVIAIFVSVGASPKKSHQVHQVAAAKLAAAAPTDLPSATASAPQNVPEIADKQVPVAQVAPPAEQEAAPASAKPSKRATPASVTSSADVTRSIRKQTRESDAPVANRQLSEPKTSPSESATPSKTAPGSKKANSGASSVASWDQGTVEHRTWMNPGF